MKINPTYKNILEISPYVPGDSVKSPKKAGSGESENKKIVKISSNENPFGCSQKVKNAIEESFSKLHRYPEGTSKDVRGKLSELYSLDANKIVCGNGSDELITLICMAYAAGEGNEILYSQHGFLMYPISALSVGAKPVKIAENGLRTDVDAFADAVNENTKIIFIANPNNPTGSYVTEEEIDRLMSKIPSDILVVLDCAYYEYAIGFDGYPDAVKAADKYDNIIMLRTFSKVYGIPNLRLGWAYSNNPEIIDILHRVRGPFNVNGLAQMAGVVALEDQEFIKKSVEHNNKCLAELPMKFESLGLKPYPSIANFILVDFGAENKAVAADKKLRDAGITGRMMQSYGLPSCMRYTIGLDEENEYLVEILGKI